MSQEIEQSTDAGGNSPASRSSRRATVQRTLEADPGSTPHPKRDQTETVSVLTYIDRGIEHPDAGGAEVWTHEVLKRLVERGHEATVFCPGFDGCDQTTEIDGIEVVRAGNRATVFPRAVSYYRRVRNEVDVVFDQLNGPPFLTPLYVDCPLVAMVHHVVRDEWLIEAPFPIGHLGYWLTDWWLKLYRSVPTVTISESTRQELSSLGFEDVTVAQQGGSVEPVEAVPEKPDRPTITFVGRLVEHKRPHHAVEAFEHVRQVRPDARLNVVGDGYMIDEIRDRAGENVQVHGYVSEERKLELLKESHVLVVPSTREGWGLVVNEANAMGTPAVGYDVKGLRDSIRHGENGLLAAEDPERLATQTLNVLETDDDRYAEGAIEVANRHSWDATADDVERRLLDVVE